MSNVDTTHSVWTFDSKTSEALSGQRLAKVLYKGRGDKPAAFPSVCVSVPPVTNLSDSELRSLLPYVCKLVEDTQDKIIRNLYEEAKGELQEVSDSQITLAAVLEFLEDESKGNRITGERVREWFDSEIAEGLRAAFEVRLGVSENPSEAEQKKLEQALNIYRDNFAKLASGKAQLIPQVAENLQKAIQIVEAEDALAVRFYERLEKMKNLPTADMLAL